MRNQILIVALAVLVLAVMPGCSFLSDVLPNEVNEAYQAKLDAATAGYEAVLARATLEKETIEHAALVAANSPDEQITKSLAEVAIAKAAYEGRARDWVTLDATATTKLAEASTAISTSDIGKGAGQIISGALNWPAGIPTIISGLVAVALAVFAKKKSTDAAVANDEAAIESAKLRAVIFGVEQIVDVTAQKAAKDSVKAAAETLGVETDLKATLVEAGLSKA